MPLSNLINKLPNFFYRVKNDKDRTSEYVSEGCFALTGYSSKDFIDEHIYFGQLILEADKDMVWNRVQNAIALKDTFNVEYRLKHKNGSIRYFWEQGQGIYDNNNT